MIKTMKKDSQLYRLVSLLSVCGEYPVRSLHLLGNKRMYRKLVDECMQQRLNGCDYDSDSMLVTNDPRIIVGVTSCYNILNVPVCKAEPIGKTDYENTPKSLVRLDQTIVVRKKDKENYE